MKSDILKLAALALTFFSCGCATLVLGYLTLALTARALMEPSHPGVDLLFVAVIASFMIGTFLSGFTSVKALIAAVRLLFGGSNKPQL